MVESLNRRTVCATLGALTVAGAAKADDDALFDLTKPTQGVKIPQAKVDEMWDKWEIELRGTKGTMYIRSNNWEVVPEKVGDFPIGYAGGKGYGTPLSRSTGNLSTQSAKTVIEPKKVTAGGSDTTAHTRNFLDCIKAASKSL